MMCNRSTVLQTASECLTRNKTIVGNSLCLGDLNAVRVHALGVGGEGGGGAEGLCGEGRPRSRPQSITGEHGDRNRRRGSYCKVDVLDESLQSATIAIPRNVN